MKIKFAAIMAILATAIFAGCATPTILSPAIPATTNAVTGVVTPAVPAVVTNLPNATVAKIVGEGEAIAPYVPAPYSAALNAVLALLTFGAGTIAAIKNRQLNSANAITATIIQGVEKAGTAASAVKTSIAGMAAANGTADAVESAVNKVTGSV
jgi:hypothetical protein